MTLLLAYEIALALIVAACIANSAHTLRLAHKRLNVVKASGVNGNARRWAIAHLRTEALLLLAQSVSLVIGFYRFWHPDFWGATLRTAITVIVALAVSLNRRDYEWIEEHPTDPPQPIE